MTVVSYCAYKIDEVVFRQEKIDKTSSQIFLSRGVAGTGSDAPSLVFPLVPSKKFVASVYESEASHFMTLGNVGAVTNFSGLDDGTSGTSITAGTIDTHSCKHRDGFDEISNEDSESEGYHCTIMEYGPSESKKGNGKAIELGRSIERRTRYQNPLVKAESWYRKFDPSFEFEVRPIEKRTHSRSSTLFDDPDDPRAELEDNVLEPCPHAPICDSVSEILGSGFDPSSTTMPQFLLDQHASLKHLSASQCALEPSLEVLTAVFNDHRPINPMPIVPVESFACQSNTDIEISATPMFDVDKHHRILEVIPPNQVANPAQLAPLSATHLPMETLQHIFYYLSHVDFNSARHTCRSWYISSFNKKLLETMLKRGGISNDKLSEIAADRAHQCDYEWLLSKRIARESALGPDWSGNGMLLKNAPTGALAGSAFVHVSTVDFTEVAVHYPGRHSAGTLFTVSSCGNFVMAANGCLIYIYELNRKANCSVEISPGFLRPVTSIVCPRRVLATSMDTSSHRYAIAILLEFRMGLVCELSALNDMSHNTMTRPIPNRTSGAKRNMDPNEPNGSSFLDPISLNISSPSTGLGPQATRPPFLFPGSLGTSLSSLAIDQTDWRVVFRGDISGSPNAAKSSPQHGSFPRGMNLATTGPSSDFIQPGKESEKENGTMPVETGPRSLYRNLCSDDDPPRSVAICPQRRCVAFGCSSGIELHWIDALTGEDLNRWFPLSAPSDFLYFLPTRKSVDWAKKLRLISSAAKPNERPAIADRSFGRRTLSSPFWGRSRTGSDQLNDGNTGAQGSATRLKGNALHSGLSGFRDGSDHYKAIPLSDGFHILFTDPASGLLCLGSDAPVGGPTKLLRKIYFQGPRGKGSPMAYTVGSDLTWGVRVVAAFGTGARQTVWLFSVPRDVFLANKTHQPIQTVYQVPSWSTSSRKQDAMCTEWVDWWPSDGLQGWLDRSQNLIPSILPQSIWPIKIRGQMIGEGNGLVDLAVDSGPRMTVWAFSQAGLASVWKLDEGNHEDPREISVRRDGTIKEIDEDTAMPNPHLLLCGAFCPDLVLPLESFDGTASFATPAGEVNPIQYCKLHRFLEQRSIQLDPEVDVLFNHRQRSENATRQEECESLEEDVLEPYQDEIWQKRETWLEQKYGGIARDFIEELTGISRIEVEIC